MLSVELYGQKLCKSICKITNIQLKRFYSYKNKNNQYDSEIESFLSYLIKMLPNPSYKDLYFLLVNILKLIKYFTNIQIKQNIYPFSTKHELKYLSPIQSVVNFSKP